MRKDYRAPPSRPSPPPAAPDSADAYDVQTPLDNPTEIRVLRLSKWVGKGINEWVWMASQVLREMFDAGQPSVASITSFGSVGAPAFFRFLLQTGQAKHPDNFSVSMVARYIVWIKLRYPKSARSNFAKTKSLLIAMYDRGLIKVDVRDAVPRGAFAGEEPDKSEVALSEREEAIFAAALKKDLIATFKGTFGGTDGEARVVQFLLVAFRTGPNSTPLFELARDAIEPNPLAPNLLSMRTVKRRAGGAPLHTLRLTGEVDALTVVPTDGAAVLNLVLQQTEPLVAKAPAHLAKRVWLYRPDGRHPNREVGCLTQSMLSLGIKALVQRHQLTGDNGKPLRITMRRLRTSKVNRQLRLSGGDIVATAAENSHSVAVEANHYVQMTPALSEAAGIFVGTVLTDVLAGKALEKTPVNHCSDTKGGAFAPRDGVRHCERFTECIGCPDFVVVGTEADLHRLFSFQEFLRADSDSIEASMEELRRTRTAQIAAIDNLVSAFPTKVIRAARELARVSPHPFWQAYLEQARLRASHQPPEAH